MHPFAQSMKELQDQPKTEPGGTELRWLEVPDELVYDLDDGTCKAARAKRHLLSSGNQSDLFNMLDDPKDTTLQRSGVLLKVVFTKKAFNKFLASNVIFKDVPPKNIATIFPAHSGGHTVRKTSGMRKLAYNPKLAKFLIRVAERHSSPSGSSSTSPEGADTRHSPVASRRSPRLAQAQAGGFTFGPDAPAGSCFLDWQRA